MLNIENLKDENLKEKLKTLLADVKNDKIAEILTDNKPIKKEVYFLKFIDKGYKKQYETIDVLDLADDIEEYINRKFDDLDIINAIDDDDVDDVDSSIVDGALYDTITNEIEKLGYDTAYGSDEKLYYYNLKDRKRQKFLQYAEDNLNNDTILQAIADLLDSVSNELYENGYNEQANKLEKASTTIKEVLNED